MPVTINGSNTPTAGGVTYGDGTQYATTAAGSAGGVLYSAGSSAPAFTAAGTSGQVLTSSGAGAPSWTTPSAGALVFISSQTVSSAVASVDFSNVFSSTYDDYVVYVSQVTASSTNTALYLRVQKSGSFLTSNYIYGYVRGISTTVTGSSSATGGEIRLYVTPGTTSNAGGSILFLGVNSTLDAAPNVVADIFYSGSASAIGRIMSGGANSITDVTTGFQILASTGTINTGTFRLYGVAKS